jgi:hypothetical protein
MLSVKAHDAMYLQSLCTWQCCAGIVSVAVDKYCKMSIRSQSVYKALNGVHYDVTICIELSCRCTSL